MGRRDFDSHPGCAAARRPWASLFSPCRATSTHVGIARRRFIGFALAGQQTPAPPALHNNAQGKSRRAGTPPLLNERGDPFSHRFSSVIYRFSPSLRFSGKRTDGEPHTRPQRPTSGRLIFWQVDSNRSTPRTPRTILVRKGRRPWRTPVGLFFAAAHSEFARAGGTLTLTLSRWDREKHPSPRPSPRGRGSTGVRTPRFTRRFSRRRTPGLRRRCVCNPTCRRAGGLWRRR
jgi:hypothetical protein